MAIVQDCQPDLYVDRTAPGADRHLNWDFSIASDPERCLQVRAGQSVFFDGVSDNHPLGPSGGDSPNPIATHHEGRVTFNAPGTFGFVCLNHSSMKGAVLVLPAAASTSTVPAFPPWLGVGLAVLLLTLGARLLRAQRLKALGF